uniref:Uncharacterized protein n=1 Tax=Siphoviridae sp. ct1Eo1 TaxID=2825307 RepID=A0A8S5P4T8_9CAUD|nr:MAG TPA: hypothetical protein [Siphoviridae sp. ct1Eo1]
MTRDDQLAALNQSILRDLPDILDAWLGDARPGLERLTRAACDEAVTDEEFRAMVADYLASGQLLKNLHPAALAEAMEHAMGTAAVIGKSSVPRV